jgi:hypothetical protein
MFTPAVLAIAPSPVEHEPLPTCVIWRRVHHRWDFFCKAPASDAERIIRHDKGQMELVDEDYEVTIG